MSKNKYKKQYVNSNPDPVINNAGNNRTKENKQIEEILRDIETLKNRFYLTVKTN